MLACCGSGLCFGVVLWMPCRGCFMWPFAVAGLGFRYFSISFSEMLGHPLRKPLRVALRSVDIVGLHRDWCANFTLLARVKIECANCAMCWTVSCLVDSNLCVGGACVVVMGMVHKSVVGSFKPCSIVLSL